MPQFHRQHLMRLCLLLLLSLSGLAQAAPQISPVTVISVSENDAGDELHLRLAAMGTEFELDMRPSAAMADISLVATSLDGVDFYAGNVVGDDLSWARLTRHDGLFTGTLRAFGRLYRLSRTEDSDTRSVANDATGNDTVMIDITDGEVGDATGADAALYPPLPPSVPASRTRWLRGTAAAPDRVMHVGALVDTLYDEHYGGAGALRALSVLNSVDGLFREELGLALHVSVMKVLTDPTQDPIRDAAVANNGEAKKVLDAFVDYRRTDADLPDELGLVHLFSGADDPNNIVGLAWIDTVCRSDGYDTSLSTPFFYDVLLAAHELGHNLGALHDDQTECYEEEDQLMWPAFTPQMQGNFSRCSVNAMASRIAAACNDDNIDLAVRLSGPTEADAGDLIPLSLTTSNVDAAHTARSVITHTRLPLELTPASLPASCSLNGKELRCVHGDLAPGAENTVELSLLVLGGGLPQVVARISADDVYDLDSSDNSHQLGLLTSGDPVLGAGGSGSGDSGGGGGAVLGLLLIGLAGLRRERR